MKTVKSLKDVKKRIVVGTHSNIFHTGEIVAIAIICLAHEENEVIIVRTKKIEELKNSDIDFVINVGDGKYGHHNKVIERRANGNLYGNAGLVWRDFGEIVVEKIFEKDIIKNKDVIERIFGNINIAREKIKESITKKVDEDIIQKIDMHQNGIKLADHPFRYIHAFLPKWYGREKYDVLFEQTLQITKAIFKRCVIKEIDEKLAEEEISNKLSYGFYGDNFLKNNILEIPKQNMPWLNIVIDYNNNIKEDKNVKDKKEKTAEFVMFPYHRGGWAAQAVPSSKKNIFEKIVPFPKEWSGETVNLAKITGVNDAIYCHKSCFFVRAGSREGVIKLCQLAKKLYNK